MEAYPYRVGGLYHAETPAHEALEKLRARGFPESQLRLIGPGVPGKSSRYKGRDRTAEEEMIEQLLIDIGAGGLVDAAGSAAQVADMALFVTEPVLAALFVAGNKATLGDVAKISGDLELETATLLDDAQEVLRHGAWVVLVLARSRDEDACACLVLAETADAYAIQS
ncbi:MAG: hypothetical protein U1F76_16965 [Candidatus Competibacteraceae bacterium]